VTYVVGITGNIATGKSLVLGRLADCGAYCIDADKMAHDCMRKGTAVWREIRRQFGDGILSPDGEVNRAVLGRIVFADPDALRTLESIVHPAVRSRIEQVLVSAGHAVVVIEAIKLLEAGLSEQCHAVWVTTCSEEEQVRRLVHRRGLSRGDAWLRVRAQPPASEKVVRADILLENEGAPEDLLATVDSEWREVEEGRAPGMGSGPSRPYALDGGWAVREHRHIASASRLGKCAWSLSVSAPSRMPRLCRHLLPAVEDLCRRQGDRQLVLHVPERIGYLQFMQGVGYEENSDGRREPGTIAFSRRL